MSLCHIWMITWWKCQLTCGEAPPLPCAVCVSDVVLSAHRRGVHVHQWPGAVSVDQTEVWDSRSDAIHSGGEEDTAGSYGSLHQVSATCCDHCLSCRWHHHLKCLQLSSWFRWNLTSLSSTEAVVQAALLVFFLWLVYKANRAWPCWHSRLWAVVSWLTHTHTHTHVFSRLGKADTSSVCVLLLSVQPFNKPQL